MKKIIYSALVTTMLVNTTACGVILYPERKGQRSGRIDVGVAALDAIGLLFFLVPGVIAFAVDFATGTIYLPGGRRADIENLDKNQMQAMHVGKENLTEENIERLIYAQTGEHVNVKNTQAFEIAADGSRKKAANPLAM